MFDTYYRYKKLKMKTAKDVQSTVIVCSPCLLLGV